MTLNEGLFSNYENIKILAMRAVMELFKLNKESNHMVLSNNKIIV